MVLDPWDVLGNLEMTEHWRSVVPALSTDVAGDRTGVENHRHRVDRVRQRYALELKHLTRTERSRGFVISRLTWSSMGRLRSSIASDRFVRCPAKQTCSGLASPPTPSGASRS
jgi:hypothetical protein